MPSADVPRSAAEDSRFFGHPAGLQTLFFTEMWERFSYYGMRALLILFMVAGVARGGLGFDQKTAGAIYGLYTAAVYLVCLPGGWVADRLLGQQRSVWWGGVTIMVGHFTLALPGVFPELPPTTIFYVGLAFIVAGTGLLKPNISAMVGQLYPGGGARRDAGFSLYYMGINLGATLGPLVCSYLGEKMNWHLGFGAAGVGMFFGLIQYRCSKGNLREVGLRPSTDPDPARAAADTRRASWTLAASVGAVLLVVAGVAVVSRGGLLRVDAVQVAQWTGVAIVGLAVLFFLWVLAGGGLNRAEAKRVVVIAIFFVGAAVFWSGFEQAGSTLNLFADRHTDRTFLGGLFKDGVHPAGYYQAVNPLFIILLAPVFAALWLRLAARQLEPSAPMKFAIGLLLLGTGFAVIAVGSMLVLKGGDRIWPTWLIATYFFHTTGELCLSPIGLSWVTKLSPPRYLGQMMGTWFMGAALGNLVGGLIAGHFDEESVEQMPTRFGVIVATTVGTGLLFALFAKPIRKLIGTVH